MKKRPKRIYSLNFSNSFPSPLPHTHHLFYLSSKKKNIKKHFEGRRKKKEKKTLSILSFSLITTHIDTSHFYFYWKNKHKNIRKRKQEKRKEKRGGDIEFFLRYVTLSSSIFWFSFYFFQFSFFFLIIKFFFPFLYCLPCRSRRMISNLDFCFFLKIYTDDLKIKYNFLCLLFYIYLVAHVAMTSTTTLKSLQKNIKNL